MLACRFLPLLVWLLATAISFAETPSEHIDALIEAKLAAHDLKPNAPIDDDTFLRRAYLSIGGRIPTIEEAEAFHSGTGSHRRDHLIGELLHSDAFVSHFYNFWADILRMQDSGPSRNAFLNYQLWVKKALRENMPYDQFVYEMVSARGKSWENGATGYYHRDRGMPLDNMSNTVRVFLGTRLECAQCHDHPFDVWTQMDYYRMAAFSYNIDARDIYTYAQNRVTTNRSAKERTRQAYLDAVGKGDGFPMPGLERLEQHIEAKSKSSHDPWLGSEKRQMTNDEFRRLVKKGWAGAQRYKDLQEGGYWAGVIIYKPLLRYAVVESDERVRLPHDYQYDDAEPEDAVEASTLFGDAIDLETFEGSPIEAYAGWMTSPRNPTFTRVIANRLWKRAFGVGLIEYVDDFTEGTQPSNPELMTYLEELMVELEYDMRAFLKVLYQTRAWQRAAFEEEVLLGDTFYFVGPALQRLSAEQIWDSLVALCIPHPESYRPLLKGQLASIEKERLMWESLEGRDYDEYVEMIETLAPLVTRQRSEGERIRFAMVEAKQKGDEAEYESLKAEMKVIDGAVSKAIAEIGYVKLHEAKKGDELLSSMMGLTEMTMTAMDSGQAQVFTSLPEIPTPEPPAELKGSALRDWEKQQRDDLRNFKGLVSKMARASELETPAPRGHFLRDFGQSDRNLIQNAAHSASVPQALNLLNGPMIEALTNRFAVFGRRLESAGSDDEKARLIFQAMLTRRPTEREMALVHSEIATHGTEGLVWALMNTQQFLFAQ